MRLRHCYIFDDLLAHLIHCHVSADSQFYIFGASITNIVRYNFSSQSINISNIYYIHILILELHKNCKNKLKTSNFFDIKINRLF